jgi:hypothetical protein
MWESSGSTDPHNLDFGASWKFGVVTPHTLAALPLGKSLKYAMDRKLSALLNQSGHEERSSPYGHSTTPWKSSP